MERQVNTPYGKVSFGNECPPDRVREILARYAYRIGLEKRKESKDAA